MLILPALALVVACSIFLIAILRPTTRPAALLGLYLLCFANIVLVGEIANSVYQLNNPGLWLSLHLILVGAAWLAWRRAGQPDLKRPWVDGDGRFLPAGLAGTLKRWPDLWLLGFGVVVVFLFGLLLIWIVAPNTNDSLSTHMARIGYWLQHGSFFPWPTQRMWQVIYPINMQLQMFWTVLFLGSDRVVEIVQWLGAVAAMVAVYGLARLLGASRPQALFAGLLLATLPEIILESTTTQNDLVAGTLFAAMLYLLFEGLRGAQKGTLALSGLALALGLGTKQTLFFLMPGLGLSLALVWLYGGKQALRSLMVWGASTVIAFVLFSAYMFVLNQIHFGHPMGPEETVESQTGSYTPQGVRDSLIYTVPRLIYQAIDPTGLPDPICGYSFKFKALLVDRVTRVAGFSLEAPVALAKGHKFVLKDRYVPQEDAAWYGPLFAVLVLPALFYQLYWGIKRKDALRMSIFVLVLTFLIINAVLRPGWDPFQGRYFIPVVMVSTALIALLVRPGRVWMVARLVVVVIALTVATNTFLLNSGKPVSGMYNIWSSDRITQETQQSFYMREPARLVDRLVPADATLGLLTFGTFQEYSFFRETFSRKLVQIDPPERIQDVAWLKAQGIEYILILSPVGSPLVATPAELRPVANLGEWKLLRWAIEQ